MIEHISTTKKRVVASLGVALIGAAITSPVASAQTLTTLVSFDGISAAAPYSALIADTNGNVFGTTAYGGSIFAQAGTVFEIGKTATGYSTPNVLVSFDGANGGSPFSGVLADTSGDLFGTTIIGGSTFAGTVFEIVKAATGYSSTPNFLVTFDRANGAGLYAGLIADATGNLFGTTANGGLVGQGTAFEITGSGFVALVRFAGVPGTSNCHGAAPLL